MRMLGACLRDLRRAGAPCASALGVLVLAACGGLSAPLSPTDTPVEHGSTVAESGFETHPSGLSLLVEPRHHAPVVAMQVWVRVGSGDETEAQAGLAHVHEHMIFKGTERRGVGEIARSIEAIGGSINAWTSFDQTVYHVVVPARFAEEGLDVLLDAVSSSVFDADELERELEVIQEEIRRGEDQPTRVLSQAVFRTAFGTHPYGRPVIGTSASVDSFERDDVVAFFERWYRPENMGLVVVGDIDPERVHAAVDDAFGGRAPIGDGRPPRAQEPPQEALRVTTHQRDIQDAYITLAFRAPELAHEDTPALELLTLLLGQGEASVLFERIQRDAGIAQNTYAYLYAPAEPGLLFVGARVPGARGAEGTEEAVSAILGVVDELRRQELPAAAIRRALTLIESDAIYQRQTVQGIANRLGYFHSVAGGTAFEERFLRLAREVTPARLREVAERYLRPEALTVGLMLPEEHEPPSDETVALWVDGAFAPEVSESLALEPDARGVVRHTFPSGLRVVIQPDDTAPLFAMRAAVMGGSLAENDATAGAGNLVAQLLTSGTERRDASAMARELDELAASMAGVSGRNTVGLRMTALSRDFDAALELFADALLGSTFPEAELSRVRRNVLADIAAQDDDVAGSTFRAFAETAFGEHPYGRSVLGSEESVTALGRADLLSWYQRYVRPSRMVISIVGDVDPRRVIDVLAARIDGGEEPTALEIPALPTPPESRHEEVRERERQQAHVVVGFVTDSLYGEDRFALDVAAAILAGQGGRLFGELRERQSLAYSVSAFSGCGLAGGTFSVYIGTSPSKVEQALAGIEAELERLRTNPPSDEEMERAQRSLIGRRDIALQRQSARAGYMVFDELYGAGYDATYRHAEQIEAVTAEAVREVAERYLDPSRAIVVITRPPEGESEASEEAAEQAAAP